MSFTSGAGKPKKPEKYDAAEDAEFEAKFNAAIATSPEARAAWERFQRELAAIGKRLTNALRRAGFEGEVNWQLMMAAWRSLGLPIEDFGRSHFGHLIRLLEARADVLDEIRGRGNPTSLLL